MGVKLKDIASACGVSATLVSQVIRNPEDPRFRPETRRLVLNAARKLQYVPNRSAANLQRGYSKLIALVTPWNMIDFTDSVERSSARAGYQTVILASAEPDVNYQYRSLELAISLQVDGVIWLPYGNPEEVRRGVKLLQTRQLPVLVFERAVEPLPEGWTLLVENYALAGELAVRTIAVPGTRQLAFISSNPEATCNRPLIEAFHAAAANAGLPVRTYFPSLEDVPDNHQRLFEALRAFVLSLPPGCSIFCDGDWLTWDVSRILPGWPALLSYGDFRIGSRGRLPELISPGISALRRPFCRLGEEAVALLLARIAGKEVSNVVRCDEIELIVRSEITVPDLSPAEHVQGRNALQSYQPQSLKRR